MDTSIEQRTDVKIAVEGLNNVRGAALLFIITSILGFIADAIAEIGVFSVISSAITGDLIGALTSVVGILIAALIILFVGLILSLIAIFAKFIPGLRKLKQWNQEFSTAYTLTRIGMIIGLILVVVGFIAAIPLVAIGAMSGSPMVAIGSILVAGGLMFIGLIFLFIGFIGIIVSCFNMNSVFRESMYMIAGILLILSLILGIISIIGIFVWATLTAASIVASILYLIAWILIYTTIPKTIAKIEAPQVPQTATLL